MLKESAKSLDSQMLYLDLPFVLLPILSMHIFTWQHMSMHIRTWQHISIRGRGALGSPPPEINTIMVD